MHIVNFLQAAAPAAPQNVFGFKEALFPHGQPNWIGIMTVVILGIMSFGSFYILFTKWVEQSKIMKQGRDLRANFWRAPSLKDGATKLDKNSAWRQLVEDGLAAEAQHGMMPPTRMTGCTGRCRVRRTRSMLALLRGCLSWQPSARLRLSSVSSERLSASTAR
jgi:hypothetical protein